MPLGTYLDVGGHACATEKPEWLDSDDAPTTLTASTNQTEVVQLTCRVRGNPAPAVTWSRTDDDITGDTYRVVDEREYRSDLYTWMVTSHLLLTGMIKNLVTSLR